MPGVKGRTGAPGVPNPKKRNSTTFGILGDEPRGKMMGFRPFLSLEARIYEAVEASGGSVAAWLMAAASAYLENGCQAIGNKLEQGQLYGGASVNEAIATEADLSIDDRRQALNAGNAILCEDNTGNWQK